MLRKTHLNSYIKNTIASRKRPKCAHQFLSFISSAFYVTPGLEGRCQLIVARQLKAPNHPGSAEKAATAAAAFSTPISLVVHAATAAAATAGAGGGGGIVCVCSGSDGLLCSSVMRRLHDLCN
jgi:hypothetical protein